MTYRHWRRQQLLWTIDHWMRRHGAWFIFVLSFCLASAAFAEEETKKPAQPMSLMKILNDKDLAATIAPKPEAAKGEIKKVSKEPKKKEAVKRAKDALPDIDDVDEKAEGTLETVRGTVSGSSRYGIAVEYGVGANSIAQEMWANYLSSTKLSGAKKFSELEYGDTVELTYKQLKDNSKKLLKSVKLIHKQPKEAFASAPKAGL